MTITTSATATTRTIISPLQGIKTLVLVVPSDETEGIRVAAGNPIKVDGALTDKDTDGVLVEPGASISLPFVTPVQVYTAADGTAVDFDALTLR